MSAQYLPAEIIDRLTGLIARYPVGSLGAFLFILGGVYGTLSWKVGRGGKGVLGLALLLSVLLVFVAAGIVIFFKNPGYRVF